MSDGSARADQVLLRGFVAAPTAGAVSGLVVAGSLAGLSGLAEHDVSITDVVFVLTYGALVGAALGLAVGLPSAVALALLRPLVRTPAGATLISMTVAAATAAVLTGTIAHAEADLVTIVALACGIAGAVVGRWVLLGGKRRPR